MKKILLSAFAVIAVATLTQAQFKVGVVAGGNLSKLRINGESSLFTNDNFKGYHAGLIAEVKLSENIYVQPQLTYTRKGATLLSSTDAATSKLRMNYVGLGANIIYKLPVGFGKIFGGAGASYSYGFNGTQEQNGQKKELYSDIKTWKRSDVSLNFTAGLELNNGLFVSANSQKGLLDVYKASNGSVKHRAYSVSIGYLMDWSKLKRKG